MAKAPKTETEDDRPAGGSERGDPVAVKADDLKTEQEKGGKDPVSDPVDPKPKEELQFNPVGPREPYPGGEAPDPELAFEAAHGFKRAKE